MKRGINLVRLILEKLEDKKDFKCIEDKNFNIKNYEQTLVEYHLIILIEAGYIQGASLRRSSDNALIDAFPERLTWQGHEFLDSIREPRIWNKVKHLGGKISFEVIKEYATILSREIL